MDATLERVERLLALILIHDMKDAPQADKASMLSRAGFAHAEIAALLGTTAGVIRQQLYQLRRGSPKKGQKRRKR